MMLAAVAKTISICARFVRIRPIVKEATDQELTTKNFNKILTDYENENGEIDGMYRDPRGSISHPHTGDVIPLGTRAVENYERPIWEFNKILIIEKEGFSGRRCESAAGTSGTIAWCCRRRASRLALSRIWLTSSPTMMSRSLSSVLTMPTRPAR